MNTDAVGTARHFDDDLGLGYGYRSTGGDEVPQPYSIEELVGGLNDLENKHAPPTLFTAGRTDLLRRRPRISIVGTRAPSPAGRVLAANVAETVVRGRGVVVSGLAKGVDTIALTTAIDVGGDVVAVIGTSLSRSYPAENRALQARLAREHLVVSQFAEGTPTGRHSFPLRNRTMALLSDATVIIEAGESSGTQHQGWEAIRLGRKLLLPSGLLDAGVTWAESMLNYGAVVYGCATDIMEILEEELPASADIDAVMELALAGA